MIVLESTWEKHGKKSASALVHWTHDPQNVPEWKSPRTSSHKITLESMMNAVGVANPKAQAQLVNDYENIDLLFKQLS